MRAEWRYAGETGEWVLAEWSGGVPLEVLGSVSAGSLTAVGARVRARVAEAMMRRYGVRPPAHVFDGPPGDEVSFTCPACWAVVYGRGLVRRRECGSCPHVVVLVPQQRSGVGGVRAGT